MDPETGRFTSEDPVKDGVNWYGYCGNNPLVRTDPSGMFQYNPVASGERAHMSISEVRYEAGKSGIEVDPEKYPPQPIHPVDNAVRHFTAGAIDAVGKIIKGTFETVTNPGQTVNAIRLKIFYSLLAMVRPDIFCEIEIDKINTKVTEFFNADDNRKAEIIGEITVQTGLTIATVRGIFSAVKNGAAVNGSSFIDDAGKNAGVMDDIGTTGNLVDDTVAGSVDAGRYIDPSKVRFSQSSISSTFKEGGAVDDLVQGLKNGTIKSTDIPAIRLVEKDGIFYTLDNRRLFAFQQANIPIQYRMATAEELAAEGWKFTTTNAGTFIKVRGQ